MDVVLNWIAQGCVVVLVLALLLRLLDRARAPVRCLLCWTSLLLVLALPLMPLLGATAAPRPLLSAADAGPLVSVPDSWWMSAAVPAAAWALWAGVFAVRIVRAMLALQRARRRSHALPAAIEGSLRHWGRLRQRGRRTALVVSDRVRFAAVLGPSPVIAVTPALVRHLDADELDRVVVHEWAHVQRRDDRAHLLQLLVLMVAGWHPAVWWIDRRLRFEREVACDELTVAITGSPKSYAACLVKLVDLPSGRHAMLPAPAVLSSTSLRRRVERIVSRRRFASPWRARGMAAAAVTVVGAVWLATGGVRFVDAAITAPHPIAGPAAAWGQPVEPIAFELPLTTDAGHPPSVRRAPVASLPPAGAPPISGPRLEPRTGGVSAADALGISTALLPGGAPELVPIDAPVALDGAVDAQRRAAAAPPLSPWNTAARAGAGIGRAAQEAGVATAGFFTRFGTRLAGAF